MTEEWIQLQILASGSRGGLTWEPLNKLGCASPLLLLLLLGLARTSSKTPEPYVHCTQGFAAGIGICKRSVWCPKHGCREQEWNLHDQNHRCAPCRYKVVFGFPGARCPRQNAGQVPCASRVRQSQGRGWGGSYLSEISEEPDVDLRTLVGSGMQPFIAITMAAPVHHAKIRYHRRFTSIMLSQQNLQDARQCLIQRNALDSSIKDKTHLPGSHL